MKKTLEILANDNAITCLRCGHTSHSAEEVMSLYCGRCYAFRRAEADDQLLPLAQRTIGIAFPEVDRSSGRFNYCCIRAVALIGIENRFKPLAEGDAFKCDTCQTEFLLAGGQWEHRRAPTPV